MKKYFILFLVLIILVGCNGKENTEKGDVDIKRVITDIDTGGNRLFLNLILKVTDSLLK